MVAVESSVVFVGSFCWKWSGEREATANLLIFLEYNVQVGSKKVREAGKSEMVENLVGCKELRHTSVGNSGLLEGF